LSALAPVHSDAISEARLHVPVEAVVGGVQLAAHEPLVERRVGVVEHASPALEPGELGRLARPPRLKVAVGLLIDGRVGEQRLRPKRLRGLELLALEQRRELRLESLGHLGVRFT